MDEQEIKYKLEQVKKDRETICKGFTEEIGNLQTQLAEAEKPKLRHGDFGYCDEPCYPRIVLDKDKLASSQHVFDRHKTDEPTVILGNVFDLIKEQSEDLTYFEFDVHRCEINTKEFAHAPILIAGNHHTKAEAEEIWHKLGRVIATLKRKENKNE